LAEVTTPRDIWSRAAQALRPPPVETLPQWIARNVILPQGLAAQPGPVQLWPHQVEIAESMGDPGIERVTWLKSVRSGFTFLLAAVIGRHVLDDPCPVILLMPTNDDARGIVVDDVEPMFDASPNLRGLLAEPGRGGGRARARDTLMHRIFPGGSLKVISGKAPRNLRRHTAKVLLAGEVDALECAEGDPLALATRRTVTFARRKIICGSSPKLADTRLIAALYADSDQRIYEVACPHCGHWWELLWQHIDWPDGDPSQAHAVCPDCGSVIEEHHKPAMVTAGRWRVTAPHVQGHHGYRSNALISLLPNMAWAKLAAEYESAKDNSDRLRAFTTTMLAEPWAEVVADIDDAELCKRAEHFDLEHIPPEVLSLTVGVDCQDDRLEVTTCGWPRDNTCFVLGHQTLWGAITGDEVWADLDDLLKRGWRHPKGGTLRVDAAVVDCSDGAHFDRVTSFCQARLGRKVLAGKGAAGMTRPALVPTKSRTGTRRLFIVGVDPLKVRILGKLAKGRAIRFSHSLEPVFYEQVASERRVARMVRGHPVPRLELIPGRQNHCLDSLTYATAARAALRLDLDIREADLASPIPPTPRQPTVIRSRFMETGRL
jgi:phage terminase large subunit GpA-like protein